MDQISDLLEMREQQLTYVKNEKEKELLSAPEGTLRINSHGNRTQYYHRTDPTDFNGSYIRDGNISLAQGLAQKDYNKKVLLAAEKELNAIKKYRMNCPDAKMEDIYEKLHKERQKLITPIWEADEQYIQKWQDVKYQGKEFYEYVPEFYTAKGERVRSKSEVIIADILNREGIPYRYEYPIYLRGIGNIYPDFTVLNVRLRKELYYEHLGIMDDEMYVDKAIQRITTYIQNGIFPGDKLILTYETKRRPLNSKMVKLMIEHYLI